jgi:hypothetical protein
MTKALHLCAYCQLDAVSQDDPQHGLCQACLTEHSESWSTLDLAYLASPY